MCAWMFVRWLRVSYVCVCACVSMSLSVSYCELSVGWVWCGVVRGGMVWMVRMPMGLDGIGGNGKRMDKDRMKKKGEGGRRKEKRKEGKKRRRKK